MSEVIRVLIADDHAVVREGLRGLIETEPEMEIIAEAENGVEVVRLAAELEPDLILLDLVMPELDGIGAIEAIKSNDPQVRILVLTSFDEDEKIFRAVKAGAQGYLLKDSSPSELLQAIRDVNEGLPSMHPTIAHKLMSELQRKSELPPTEEPLSEREVEVLKLVAQGLPNQEIAEALVLSERTVRTHVSNILGKLHLANRTQAALYALREGLADLGDS
jgi:NarL family two-component system response regulator LiaR